MSRIFFILDDDERPIAEPDPAKWASWFTMSNCVTARTMIGEIRVQTDFLGISDGREPPRLWETMIFGGRWCGYQERFSSLSEAHAGHRKAVALVESIETRCEGHERTHAEEKSAKALINIANECRQSAERECGRLREALREVIRMAHLATTDSYTDNYKREQCEHLTKTDFPMTHSYPIADQSENLEPPKINESLLCSKCGNSWRVISSIDCNGSLQLIACKDREREANAEMSHCPSCATSQDSDRGARFLRPVPTRQRMREAIKELIDRVEIGRSPSDPYARSSDSAKVVALRKEFGL